MPRFWPFGHRETLHVTVQKGERGRWRWFARHDSPEGHVVAECPVYGYATEEGAREAAKAASGAKWEV